MEWNQRSAGVLCPIFSLPSNEGIGTLGTKAYEFIDCLASSKQAYWQVLPIGVTSYGDSPYQSFSSFAGNPYFIDLEMLKKEGLLKKGDLDIDWGHPNDIDYEKLWNEKYKILRKAFQNSSFSDDQEAQAYLKFSWLKDYATFMALKHYYKGVGRVEWETGSVKTLCDPSIIKKIGKEIKFHVFLQSIFFEQWFELKQYAHAKKIALIGDLPIFVANDSVDVWAHPEYFYLDEHGNTTAVAGVPPDYFSETGQLWGNPLYDWKKIEADGFRWWVDRIKQTMTFFDAVRIDHFRAFESYWHIPQGEVTAINGKWVKAPGQKFFDVLKQELGELPIIAEDLGIITEEVVELMKYTGFPGMAILHFAFDHHEDNPYKPHNIIENKVVYTGTHDNNTTLGWYQDPQNQESVTMAKTYIPEQSQTAEDFVKGLIELAWGSKARIAVLPIQDLLMLGEEAKINTPSTLGTNWKWRMSNFPNISQQQYLKEITEKYQRA